jgi:hypothetical protein
MLKEKKLDSELDKRLLALLSRDKIETAKLK